MVEWIVVGRGMVLVNRLEGPGRASESRCSGYPLGIG